MPSAVVTGSVAIDDVTAVGTYTNFTELEAFRK
jgi:hypothetical protein